MSEAETKPAEGQAATRTCASCGAPMADNRRKYCSDECKAGKPQAPEAGEAQEPEAATPDELADRLLQRGKSMYLVSEVSEVLAAILEIRTTSANSKIYRGIERGDVRVKYYLGQIRIPHREAERLLKGESNV